MRRAVRTAALAVLYALVAAAPPAAAAPYLPGPGRTWTGVTAGQDIRDFQARVGKHPAVWQHFIAWNGLYRHAIARGAGTRTRLMLHLSTALGQNLPERLSPGAIAGGRGDGFLVALARDLAALNAPVYLRLMGEMNNCNNAYASHDCAGRRRDRAHSPRAFKRAWRRTHVILRGGSAAAVNARLRALRLPPLRAGGAELARPRVAFVWAPMTGGSPEIAALRPQVFWPGRRWVDWVGTTFYSRFPNFNRLGPFYAFAQRARKPFALAEWAMWGADDAGFARRLFRWIAARPGVRMVSYNQGAAAGGPFRLRRYPRAARVIRRALAAPRFQAYAPEHDQAATARGESAATKPSRQLG